MPINSGSVIRCIFKCKFNTMLVIKSYKTITIVMIPSLDDIVYSYIISFNIYMILPIPV